MISMYTKQEIIIRHYISGHSQRSISRELGISRDTVRYYLSTYEEKLSELGSSHEALQACLSEPITYDSSSRSKKKLSEAIAKRIDDLLWQNAAKHSSGLHKQVLKGIDIHQQLNEEGHDIGYTTVCQYIRDKKASASKEVFIRQSYSVGSSCEFDWAEVKLEIAGKSGKYQLAVFTSSYSNYRYACLYSRQDTLSFLEAHVGFMNHCEGSYGQMVYDNMRVAVSKFVGKHEKQPTRALLDLRAHYQFTHRFCNSYKGNEKGHVERSVEYVRRKSFGFKHQFSSLQQANEYLEKITTKLNATTQQLTQKSANELFEEEKPYLRTFPQPMECSELTELRVDKYSTISLKTNRYSAPEELVGQFVEVKVYSDKLEIFHDNKLKAQHSRSYQKHDWIIRIEHYLETFKTKPGALANSTALISNRYLKSVYDQYFDQQPRAFIDLLHYCYSKQVAQDQFCSTLDQLLVNTPEDKSINAEALMALLGNFNSPLQKHYSTQDDSQIKELSKQHLQKVTNLLSN